MESAVSVWFQSKLNSLSGIAVKSLRVTGCPVRIFAVRGLGFPALSVITWPLPSRQRSRVIDQVASACNSVDFPVLLGPARTMLSDRVNSCCENRLKFSMTTFVIISALPLRRLTM